MPDKGEKKVKTKKKVKFTDNEIRSYSNDSEKVEYRKSVEMGKKDKLAKCDMKKLRFPCVYRGMTFDSGEEMLKYIELKTVNVGLKRENAIEILKYMGKYQKQIEKENRLYNLDTGEIYSVLDYITPPTTPTRGGTRKRNKKNKSVRRFRV